MRFVVDETSLRPWEPADQWSAAVERLAQAIATCHRHDETVGRDPELWAFELSDGVMLTDVVYGGARPLDRELRDLLMQTLNRCVSWAEIEGCDPGDGRVLIDNVEQVAPSVAIAHQRVARGKAVCCLSAGLQQSRVGNKSVRRGDIDLNVLFIARNDDLKHFYRTLFEIEDMDRTTYMLNAPKAFPDVYFDEALANQFVRFRTSYADIRSIVTKHLAVLNDHFQRIFAENKYQPDLTSKVLNAEHDVDATPESPKTRANKAAMKEREVQVSGKTVVCEWHTKIAPGHDRIHFAPASTSRRLVVGIFAEHLSL